MPREQIKSKQYLKENLNLKTFKIKLNLSPDILQNINDH